MSYRGLTVPLPVGQQGFTGTENPSQAGPGHLLYTDGAELDAGIIRKEGGASKFNAAAIESGAVIISGFNWLPVPAQPRDYIFTSTGKVLKDTGAGTFPTTMVSSLNSVREPPPLFAPGGGEALGASRRLFMFSSVNQVHSVGGDANTMSPISNPAIDWSGAGNFPAFGLLHGMRMWAGGNASDPHRMYFSTIGDHQDFKGDHGNDIFTKVLLHFSGADASTTITDSNAGGAAHTWTAAGDAQIDTDQSKFGGSALLGDGTGDLVRTPDHNDYTLGTHNFTIDMWVRSAAAGTTNYLAGQTPVLAFGDPLNAWWLERTAANALLFTFTSGSVSHNITGGTLNDSNWHHVAVTRSDDVFRLFLDGVVIATNTISASINNSAGDLVVGGVSTSSWNGHFDEFRLSVGIARWTANFTPPTNEYSETPAGGTGSLAVYPGEGERLVAAISFRGALAVFKYPAGIYIINTIDPSVANWTVTPLTRAVGTLNQHTIVPIENDVLYMDAAGSIHALSTTNEFGDLTSSDIGEADKIQRFIQRYVNLPRLRRAVGIWYGKRNQAWFSVPLLGSDDNALRFITVFEGVAQQNTPPIRRFFMSRRDIPISMWLRPDAANIPTPAHGDNAGFVWNMDTEVRSKAGAGYPIVFETANTDFAFFDPQMATRMKGGQFLELSYEPRGSWDLTVEVFWDDILTDTILFGMGSGAAVLGSFILDTDVLASSVVRSKRERMDGSGRRLRLIAENSGAGQDVSLSGFFVSMTLMDERDQ